MKTAIAASCLALGLFAPCALAATPSNGVLTIHETELTFTNGPIVGVNPTPFVSDQTGLICNYDLTCDRFDLTIDLPDNITDFFPSPVVKILLSWDSPYGAAVDDYDLYVYDEGGNQIAFSADLNTAASPMEAVTIPVGAGQTAIYMDIMYFLATGSSITGQIRLDLGPASEDADLDTLYAENPPPADSFFIPEDASSEEVQTSSRSAHSTAGGSLNLLMLVFAGLLGTRRLHSAGRSQA